MSSTTKTVQKPIATKTTHVEAVQPPPAPVPVPDTTPAPEPVVDTPTQPTEPVADTTVSGSSQDWMAAAGISSSDYTYVDYIISHESGWNPDATNVNSGAHGLPQALPYDKTGCGWDDAICQLQWANSYAVSRYGSWGGAYDFWVSNHYW